MSFWAAKGLTRIDGKPLGQANAGLVLPAGPNGPAFLVTHNFDVVYSYNAAESESLAACVLADRLCKSPGHSDALADRRSRPLAGCPPGIAYPPRQTWLRCWRAGWCDRGENENCDY